MNISALSPHVRRVKSAESRGLSPDYVDPDYVFTYITGGGGLFLLEGVKYAVKKGDLLLMPPYMRHIINTDGARPLGQHVIHFDLFFDERRVGAVEREQGMSFQSFAADSGNPERLLSSGPYALSLAAKDRAAVEKSFLELKDAFKSQGPCACLKSKAIMLDLLCLYLRVSSEACGAGKKAGLKVWRNLERAIDFIHASYGKRISLEEISSEACLSPNYFCALFKDYTGSSPHKYLNTLRVKEAKKLIDEGEQNFTQVAESVGFSSLALFSRVFKSVEGASPSEYKAGFIR